MLDRKQAATDPTTPLETENPSKWILARRFAASIYDAILVIAILLIAALPWSIAGITPSHIYFPVFNVYLYAIITFYFTWFWSHGQTPGMKTWKLQVVGISTHRITAYRAWLRLHTAIPSIILPGIALLIALFSDDKRTWYDKLSQSRVVMKAS